MGKTTLFLMIITLISKFTGLLREQVFAYFLGTSALNDVYVTSSTIPMIIFSFIVSGIVASYIPIYSKIESESGETKAREFTSNLINVLLIISVFLLVIMLIFAPIFVTLFAPSYAGSKRELTIAFTRIMSFSIFTNSISAILIGYLQMKNRFAIAESPGIFMNFLIVIFLTISMILGNVYIIAIGFVLTEALKYFLFPRTLKQENYNHKFIVNFKDSNLLLVLKKALPVIVSIAATDISTMSDQAFASLVQPTGGVSMMRYSALMMQLISGVLVISVATTIYPTLARYANQGEDEKLNNTLMDSTGLSLLLVLPAMAGVMVLSQPLIRLLFQRGEFGAQSTEIIGGILFFYIPTILGYTIYQVFLRGFYAKNDTITPIFITLSQVVVNIALNYFLSRIWGLNGLAIATTTSSLVAGLLYMILYRKKYGRINFTRTLPTIIKSIFATLIMSFFTYLVYNSLESVNYILAFILSFIASVLIYGLIIVFMRIPQVMKTVNILYHKFAK